MSADQVETPSPRWVEIEFDCLPMRSITRLAPPDDASPGFIRLVERIRTAVDKHGVFNSYYLHRARCTFHLTNDPQNGMVDFRFEGTILTDDQDRTARTCDLSVVLHGETCPWLIEPVVQWFHNAVEHAVMVEFNRYVAAGDLARTEARLRAIQQQSDNAGGFIGMYL
jgi:hypothetical protein